MKPLGNFSETALTIAKKFSSLKSKHFSLGGPSISVSLENQSVIAPPLRCPFTFLSLSLLSLSLNGRSRWRFISVRGLFGPFSPPDVIFMIMKIFRCFYTLLPHSVKLFFIVSYVDGRLLVCYQLLAFYIG